MKKLIAILAISFSYIVSANVDCLRYMNKKSTLIWQKSCSVMVEDQGQTEVKAIDACFGKYKYNKREFFVLNSDLRMNSLIRPKESIIVSGATGIHATETDVNILIDKLSASPELLKRYRHHVEYDKITKILSIKKSTGLFNLSETHNLKIECD